MSFHILFITFHFLLFRSLPLDNQMALASLFVCCDFFYCENDLVIAVSLRLVYKLFVHTLCGRLHLDSLTLILCKLRRILMTCLMNEMEVVKYWMVKELFVWGLDCMFSNGVSFNVQNLIVFNFGTQNMMASGICEFC